MIPGAIALKIDALTGDLVIEEGDFVWVAGIDAIGQDVRAEEKMFQGEWFLDLLAGMPYFQEILGQKPVNLLVIREIYRQHLLGIPGVLEVLSIETSFAAAPRMAQVNWHVSTDLGELRGEQTI